MEFLTFKNDVGTFYFCHTVGCINTYMMFNTSNDMYYISDNTDVERLLSWYKCEQITQDLFFSIFDKYVTQEKNFISLLSK